MCFVSVSVPLLYPVGLGRILEDSLACYQLHNLLFPSISSFIKENKTLVWKD